MDYTKNEDKLGCTTDYGLYNSVLKVTFSNEGDEPVTPEEAKKWCKIEDDQTDDDEIIEELITTARQTLEDLTGVGFIARTVVATINNANGGFVLPYGPVTSDVVVTDSDATWSDLRGEYEVTYDGGWSTTDIPKKLKTAIKEQVLFLYENRGESNIGLSPVAEQIAARFRTVL